MYLFAILNNMYTQPFIHYMRYKRTYLQIESLYREFGEFLFEIKQVAKHENELIVTLYKIVSSPF